MLVVDSGGVRFDVPNHAPCCRAGGDLRLHFCSSSHHTDVYSATTITFRGRNPPPRPDNVPIHANAPSPASIKFNINASPVAHTLCVRLLARAFDYPLCALVARCSEALRSYACCSWLTYVSVCRFATWSPGAERNGRGVDARG